MDWAQLINPEVRGRMPHYSLSSQSARYPCPASPESPVGALWGAWQDKKRQSPIHVAPSMGSAGSRARTYACSDTGNQDAPRPRVGTAG
ncbi:MAG: hypothetical protein C7B43_18470 [Sulfobacillus benefaciens]|uniref:Uncharacterized protein n=1 Tax=Sulfobacillus benefaciens TaxID=453960 RepID=A0A2T2WR49_9FIRM|nr:MAG: hypothetical protein C7B43_18470 [Sulfobacillus benefaciens]